VTIQQIILGGADAIQGPETTLLLHMDGVPGGTLFFDRSPIQKIFTASGASTSPVPKKFGTAAGSFPNLSSYITTPSHTGFDFGTGDFTVECWIYRTAAAGISQYGEIVGNALTASGVSWAINEFVDALGDARLRFLTYSALILESTVILPALNQWVSIAVTRSGGTVRLFVNGAVAGTATSASNFSTNNALRVGSQSGTGMRGYVEELRITKGLALYVANYTPATIPFPDSPGTQVFATWNPADKGSGVSLSGGNLISDYSDFLNSNVRATMGKTTGKWYWEVQVNAFNVNAFPNLGMWPQSRAITTYINGTTGVGRVTNSSLAINITLGVQFDAGAGTGAVYRNGVLVANFNGVPLTITEPWKPVIGEDNAGGAATFTANFGALNPLFLYAPPGDYNLGIYEFQP